SSNTAEAEKKKGISKAAKGAIIGGVAGAAAGAVINKKNRAVGAVIGGIIGAAGGYGVGRGQDKKDGRIPMIQ
ncbi:MAG: glycine zipper 2TM domain-containing protein, partial [Chitinophagaceae bacterium]